MWFPLTGGFMVFNNPKELNLINSESKAQNNLWFLINFAFRLWVVVVVELLLLLLLLKINCFVCFIWWWWCCCCYCNINNIIIIKTHKSFSIHNSFRGRIPSVQVEPCNRPANQPTSVINGQLLQHKNGQTANCPSRLSKLNNTSDNYGRRTLSTLMMTTTTTMAITPNQSVLNFLYSLYWFKWLQGFVFRFFSCLGVLFSFRSIFVVAIVVALVPNWFVMDRIGSKCKLAGLTTTDG